MSSSKEATQTNEIFLFPDFTDLQNLLIKEAVGFSFCIKKAIAFDSSLLAGYLRGNPERQQALINKLKESLNNIAKYSSFNYHFEIKNIGEDCIIIFVSSEEKEDSKKDFSFKDIVTPQIDEIIEMESYLDKRATEIFTTAVIESCCQGKKEIEVGEVKKYSFSIWELVEIGLGSDLDKGNLVGFLLDFLKEGKQANQDRLIENLKSKINKIDFYHTYIFDFVEDKGERQLEIIKKRKSSF